MSDPNISPISTGANPTVPTALSTPAAPTDPRVALPHFKHISSRTLAANSQEASFLERKSVPHKSLPAITSTTTEHMFIYKPFLKINGSATLDISEIKSTKGPEAASSQPPLVSTSQQAKSPKTPSPKSARFAPLPPSHRNITLGGKQDDWAVTEQKAPIRLKLDCAEEDQGKTSPNKSPKSPKSFKRLKCLPPPANNFPDTKELVLGTFMRLFHLSLDF